MQRKLTSKVCNVTCRKMANDGKLNHVTMPSDLAHALAFDAERWFMFVENIFFTYYFGLAGATHLQSTRKSDITNSLLKQFFQSLETKNFEIDENS